MKKFTPIIALPIGLAVLYGLSEWFSSARHTSSQTFQVTPLLWSYMAIGLIFAATLLTLFWLVTWKDTHSLWASAAYLMVGLILVFALPLYRVLGRVLSYYYLNYWLIDGLPLAGAFMTFTGFAGLLRGMVNRKQANP